jgi:Na+/proline symporter
MINVFISIFIAVLIGVGFIGPIATQVKGASATGGDLYNSSTWGASTLKMVPGFYSLVILGVVIGGLFAVFRQTGIQ